MIAARHCGRKPHGVGAIPARWREGLRGQELYQPLLRALLER